MATRWSSEFTVAEHKDLQASAMAVDYSGIYILLAGRRYLGVKNLEDTSDLLHKFPRHSKYEVGVAEWNPSFMKKEICALTSNQRVELMTWQSGTDLVLTHSLCSHTRVVSDLSWHRYDPNLLASCSIDTFVYIWDMRDTRKPVLSFSAVAGATQVQWNRMSRYLLATAHDRDIKLWDQRKGTAPVQYIAAHLSKINGLDWSPSQENQLATSSQDCTVKFFDVTNPRRAEMVLTTSSPVWRARYTPFGTGMVTVVVPQLRRGENGLLLWNISSKSAPVHTFVGHTDVVLEFEWRKVKGGDASNYQLITWSKDQSLRIWKIDPLLIKLCGEDKEDEDEESKTNEEPVVTLPSSTNIAMEPTLTHPLQPFPIENGSDVSELLSSMSVIEEASENSLSMSTDKEVNPSPTQPKTLQQEFSLININIPYVHVDAMDPVKRSCTVTTTRNGYLIVLVVNFPPSYPHNTAPTFQFGQGTSVDSMTMAKILKALKQTALQRVRKNKSCLEPCIRQLVYTLDQMPTNDDSEVKPFRRFQSQSSSFLEPSSVFGSYQEAYYVPFPRTSGARFCSVGALVCFGRPVHVRRLSRLESPTPRSLSALGSNHVNYGSSNTSTSQYSLIYPPVAQSPTGDPSVSIASFYFQDRLTQKQSSRSRSRGIHSARTLQNTSKTQSAKKTSRVAVTVYDISSLFFVHRELGEKYVFNSEDVPSMCHRNSAIAATVGRKDLVQVWTIAALAASSSQSSQDDDAPWPHHPFGRATIEMLIDHYAKQSDIQMAAMLCCAFSSRTENQDFLKNKQLSKSVTVSRLATGKWWLKPGGSPYHTIHQVDLSLEGWNYTMLKQNRSNSWSDSLDDFKIPSNIIEHREFSEVENEKNIRMLDEKNTLLYDSYKRAYADMLYRWNLLDAHAQVLKYLSTSPEPHRGVEFVSECHICGKQMPGPNCYICKKFILQCAICHVSVRGSSNYCLVCGHGGHTNHMLVWFETQTVCPTGCGCHCLTESSNVFEH